MNTVWANAISHHLKKDDSHLIKMKDRYIEYLSRMNSTISFYSTSIGFFTSFIPIYHLFRTPKMIYELFSLIKMRLLIHYPEIVSSSELKHLFKLFIIMWTEIPSDQYEEFDINYIGTVLEKKFRSYSILKNISGFMPGIGAAAGIIYVNSILSDAENSILKMDFKY